MSVYFPIHCPDYLRSAEMTEVMMNTPSMEEIGLSPGRMAFPTRKAEEGNTGPHGQVADSEVSGPPAEVVLDSSFQARESRSVSWLQIFPDPSDFDRCCKLKDRLPSIVVEPTEGEVESGELRWPPEEFLVQEDEQDNCEETTKEKKEQ